MDASVEQAMWSVLERPEVAERIVRSVIGRQSDIRAVRVRQVLLRPGQRASMRVDVAMSGAEGSGDPPGTEHLALVMRRDVLRLDRPVTTVEGLDTAVWRMVDDPRLPGLGTALDGRAMEPHLRAMGLPAERVRPVLRAYRPLQRAVVEVPVRVAQPMRLTFSPGRSRIKPVRERSVATFAKCLRLQDVDAVTDAHERLAGHAPVASCLRVRNTGLLLLAPLAGDTLGACIRRGLPLPPPDAFVAMLDRLAGAGTPTLERAGSDARLDEHIALLTAVVPEQRVRLERVRDALGAARTQPRVPVHADFHEGNLLVHDGKLSGLLDVDGWAEGERVDDLGLLLGRVWVYGQERSDEHCRAYAADLEAGFSASVEPDELRRRAGVAIVGRISGPFRGQAKDWRAQVADRLALAEQWVARASRRR